MSWEEAQQLTQNELEAITKEEQNEHTIRET
jgi:hypothetical protein